MVKERRHFSQKTVENLVNICYKCDLPDFTDDEQKSFMFFFAAEEPARKSKKRLIKAYPNAQYKDIKNYGHCSFQAMEPQKYAQMLKDSIKNRI